MYDEFFSLAHRLEARGEPFAIAVVVRAEPPTSARPGDKAIVTADGVLHGWIGGSCAHPTVVEATLAALADGRSRLLRLSSDPGTEPPPPGYEALPMVCYSGGTLDVYVEPQPPQPRLIVVGDLPVARALAHLGDALGYRVLVVRPAGPSSEASDERAESAGRERSVGGSAAGEALRAAEVRGDLAALAEWATPHSYIVVATHGTFDEPALAAALGTPAPYVALVASRKRAAAVRAWLEGEGLGAELSRLRAPAGLDIGAVRGDEIALSILAEIVRERRRGVGVGVERPASSAMADERATAIGEAAAPAVHRDPVCGMEVRPPAATPQVEHDGAVYYFCCAGCAARFAEEPARYLPAGAASP